MRPRKQNIGLPKCVYKKGGSFYYVRNNRWHFLGKTIDKSKLEELYDLHGGRTDSDASINYLLEKFHRHKHQAVAKGREWTISKEQVAEMFDNQSGACALTGIKFNLSTVDGIRIKPYAPSLDRIDNSKGYFLDNCRLVLNIVNIIRGTMTDTFLITMARALALAYKRSIR